MYEYVTKEQMKPYKMYCQSTLDRLKKRLKGEHSISVYSALTGSGARNMVTRNGNGAFDLDYDLVMTSIPKEYTGNLKMLKIVIRNTLDELMGANFSHGQDSTSSITYLVHSLDGKKVEFQFDVALLLEENGSGNRSRLIHNKDTGAFIWNLVPDEKKLEKKEAVIKQAGRWIDVKRIYLDRKNMYLKRQDYSHSSSVVYREVIHEVYQSVIAGEAKREKDRYKK